MDLALGGGHDPYATSQCQTPSLLSSSACSSIGSPIRPASILNNSQHSPPPVVVTHLTQGGSVGGGGGGGNLVHLFCSTGQQQQQQQQQHKQQHQQVQQQLYHQHTGPRVYHHQQQQQQLQQACHHHSYGGGNSSGTASGGSSTISASDSLNMSINLEQYISKRNERERSRVRNVNDAFDHLKNSLPLETEKMSKRMSKVEILRTAIGYIRELEHMLGCDKQTAQRGGAPGSRGESPSGCANKSRPAGRARPFGGANGGGERDHQAASAKVVALASREFAAGSQLLATTGENRVQNFGGATAAATGPTELHNQQQPRQPFQPDLNHNNQNYSNQMISGYSHGFSHEYSTAKSLGDCRQDQQQHQQQWEGQMAMSYEEY